MSRMKVTMVCLAAAVVMGTLAAQSVPTLISYQGQLNNSSGVPVNGSISFVFSIYGVPTGGAALWTEAQTISVSNGIFNVQLGAVTAIPSMVFAADTLYLGIKVGADSEMTPRQLITSSVFSQRAETIKNKFSLHGNLQIGPNGTKRVDIPIIDDGAPPKVHLYLRGMKADSTTNVPKGLMIAIDGAWYTGTIGDQNSKGPTMYAETPYMDTGANCPEVKSTSYVSYVTRIVNESVTKALLALCSGNIPVTSYGKARFNYSDGTSAFSTEWSRTSPPNFVYVQSEHVNPFPAKRVNSIEAMAHVSGNSSGVYVCLWGYIVRGLWGVDGVTEWNTGPLDLSNVVNWTRGEHFIEFKESGGFGGTLIYLILVN